MSNTDSNVFDSSAAALQWTQANRSNGLAADALAAAGSEAPQVESLVFHNVPYLLPDDADSSDVAREFTTSCLLRADDVKRLSEREPLPPALAPDTDAFVVRKVSVPMTQRAARENDVGMHATRAIASSEVVFVEWPTLLLPSHLWLGAVSQDFGQLVATLLGRLPSTQAEAVRGLKNPKPKTVLSEEGIVRTNGIAVNLGDENTTYTGIFLNIARCNHSCFPNAALHWDIDTLTMTLCAVRNIEKDAEITIAYIDILLPFMKRRYSLKASYGFDCHCEKCSRIPAEREKSDIARTKLRGWAVDSDRATFARWFASTDPTLEKRIEDRKKETDQFAKLLTRLLEIYGTEKISAISPPLLEISDAAVRLRGALGEKVKFRTRLRDAIEAWKQQEVFNLHARRRIAPYQKWLDLPESFPLWKKRLDARPDPRSTGKV